MSPSALARATASTWLWTPKRRNADFRYPRTVCGLRKRPSAMSGMVDPRASSHKTSASRGASWLTLGRLAAARRSAPEQCARRTAESTSANPLSLDTHWAAPAATAIVAETASRFDANVTRVMEGCAFRSRRTQSRPLTPPTPNVTNATSTVASLSRCVAAGNVNAQPADLNPAWNSIARANDSANARS